MRSVEDVERALERYGDSVMGLACSLLRCEADAFDVAQETFARYFTSDETFESERHEKNWLLKVAGNLCRDELRKARRRYERPSGLDVGELPAALAASGHAGAVGLMAAASPTSATCDPYPGSSEDHAVWDYVGLLAPTARQMIHLRYVEELDIGEIAGMLGTTEVNVRVSLHRARKRLREMMGSHQDGRKGGDNA